MSAAAAARSGSYVEVDPVLPRVFDDLWAQHGDAIRAAQLAAVEAEADALEAWAGTAWNGSPA